MKSARPRVFDAKCMWPDGQTEIVTVETNMGKEAAELMVNMKLEKEYEIGGRVIAITEMDYMHVMQIY